MYNAVVGCTDGHALLARLFDAQLFPIHLDDEGGWYRYHHMFADLLANRLQQTLPAKTVQELHCRASEWLAQNDLLDGAIEHAVKEQDCERAASLAKHKVGTMIFSGRVFRFSICRRCHGFEKSRNRP